MWVSGSNDPPCQFVPPPSGYIARVPKGPSGLLTTGGVKIGPILNLDTTFRACSRNSGVKSIRSFTLTPWRSYAGGFVGNGCVGLVFSPGTSDFSTGRSSMGQIGWPVTRSKTYTHACFVGWAIALILLPLMVMSARIGAHGMSQSQM